MTGCATEVRGRECLGNRLLSDQRRLIVVSNRLPIVTKSDCSGDLQVEPSSGGLFTALSPVLRNTGGLWIGCLATTAAVQMSETLHGVCSQLGRTLEPVLLSDNELSGYYSGFSNQILWPLFHDFPAF